MKIVKKLILDNDRYIIGIKTRDEIMFMSFNTDKAQNKLIEFCVFNSYSFGIRTGVNIDNVIDILNNLG